MSGEINSTKGPSFYYVIWAIINICISFTFVFYGNSVISGFFFKLFAAVIAIIGGSIGFFICDAVRKFAMPDVIYTSGGILSILIGKIFWLCGPQIIGIVVGNGLVLSQFEKFFK